MVGGTVLVVIHGPPDFYSCSYGIGPAGVRRSARAQEGKLTDWATPPHPEGGGQLNITWRLILGRIGRRAKCEKRDGVRCCEDCAVQRFSVCGNHGRVNQPIRNSKTVALAILETSAR